MAQKTPQYVTLNLSELHEDPRNSRRHGEENLASIRNSLAMFGQYRPIVIRKENNEIIVGHGLYRVMCELGWKKAECVVLDVTRAEAAKINVGDNRSSELAEWDVSKLVKMMDEVDLTECGFSEDSLAELANSMRDRPPPPVKGVKTFICPKCHKSFTKGSHIEGGTDQT